MLIPKINVDGNLMPIVSGSTLTLLPIQRALGLSIWNFREARWMLTASSQDSENRNQHDVPDFQKSSTMDCIIAITGFVTSEYEAYRPIPGVFVGLSGVQAFTK